MTGVLGVMLGVGAAGGGGGGGGGGMTAAAAPTATSGTRIGGGLTYSGTVTASPTGGTGPYTYAWARTGGGTTTEATTPSAASTTFRTYFDTGGQSRTAYFVCTVTDSLGAVANTAAVTVSLTSTVDTSGDGGGGGFGGSGGWFGGEIP